LPDVIIERRDGRERLPAIAEGAWPTGMMRWFLENRPIATPIYQPPERWTEFENSDGTPFLLGCRDEDAAKAADMRKHMDAVSYLQSTPWRINEPVLKFVQALGKWERPPLLGFKSRQSWHPRDRANWRVFDWDLDRAERLLARDRPFWTEIRERDCATTFRACKSNT